MSQTSWDEARQIVLARLQQIRDSLPASEQNLPRVVISQRTLSYNDMIREVSIGSELGNQIIVINLRSMGYTVG